MIKGSSDVDQVEAVTKNKAPLYISIVIIATVILGYFLIPGVQDFMNNAFSVLTSNDEQHINVWVSQFGFWGPFVIIIAMVVQMFLIVIPSLLLIVVAVLAYGPVWGSLIAILAIFCASTVGYIIGAYFGPVIVTKLLGARSRLKVEKAIFDYGFWAVIVTRLNPFLSNDAISFAGGMLKMGYWRFMGATVIGIIPLTVFIAYLGENTQEIKNGFLGVGIISVILFGGYIWWDKRRKKRFSRD